MRQPPTSGRLLNKTVAIRAFGILGPTEAVFEMCAFVLALVIAGWTVGGEFPTGPTLYAASGAAFLTVVVGQSANAFACRSTRRPAWQLGWRSNRFLAVAVLAGFAFAVSLVLVPAAADLLDQQWPPAGAWIIILAAAPGVILVDALWKRLNGHTPDGAVAGPIGRPAGRSVSRRPRRGRFHSPQQQRDDQSEKDQDTSTDEDRGSDAVAAREDAPDERSDRHSEVDEEPVAGPDAAEQFVRDQSLTQRQGEHVPHHDRAERDRGQQTGEDR
jgi:hypothetical protein